MEYVVTGANGQLGRALQKLLPQAVFVDVDDLDIADQDAVESFSFPENGVLINAAAYTNVDNAETEEGEAISHKVNVEGVRNLVEAANKHNMLFVNVSTDYVFDGESKEPYTEDANKNPQNVYGKTKLAGERETEKANRYYLVRTSWVYGDGRNFVKTMLELAKKHDTLTVVNDQVGRPTNAEDLAKAMMILIENKVPFGTYNFTNDGEPIHWADFARAIFDITGTSVTVKEVDTQTFAIGKSPFAKRPQNSVLNLAKIKAAGVHVSNWRDSLEKFITNQPE